MEASRRASSPRSRPAGPALDRPSGQSPVQPIAHAIMFYVLSGLAVAIFAPCVLVPAWQQSAQLREYHRDLAVVVAGLQGQVEANRARTERWLSDPLVNERAVRREFNYQAPGEQVIRSGQDTSVAPTAISEGSTPRQRAVAIPPNPVPRWVTATKQWLPAWNWSFLFARSPNRELLLLMSGGLLLTAFILYAPHRREFTRK